MAKVGGRVLDDSRSGGGWRYQYRLRAQVPRGGASALDTFVRGPGYRAMLRGGNYLVVVFDPNGGAGGYGLTLGRDEVVGGDPDRFVRFAPWPARQPVRGADPWDPLAIG